MTVTLPEATIKRLRRIDRDRGTAIVKLTEDAMKTGGRARAMVEVIEMTAGTGLLVVANSPTLRGIPFLHLVEVAPMRFLLSLEPGHDFQSLELAIVDALDTVPGAQTSERELITQVLEQIRKARQEKRFTMAEILMVNLGDKRGSKPAGGGRGGRKPKAGN